MLMKIDVKEFFYSGNADQLCEDSGACFESENQLFNEVLKFLIENLYVSDPQVFEETFKVVIGTGMGLPESADVGDASFLNRVDKKILAPGFRRAVGMDAYWRYRDDLLFLMDTAVGEGKRFKLIKHMKSNARYFRLQVDDYGSRELEFLDLSIHLVGSRVVVNYFQKPNLGPPLSLESGHNVSVHNSWPAAMMKRIKRVSSTKKAAEAAVSKFKSRFTDFFVPSDFIPKEPDTRLLRPVITWVPMGYHPAVQRVLGHSMKVHQTEFRQLTRRLFSSGQMGTTADEFRIAWYNSLPSLHIRLRSQCRL